MRSHTHTRAGLGHVAYCECGFQGIPQVSGEMRKWPECEMSQHPNHPLRGNCTLRHSLREHEAGPWRSLADVSFQPSLAFQPHLTTPKWVPEAPDSRPYSLR